MAYLSLDSFVFLGNYDSLVESCFDYAFENEDECLFEEVLLNELSHSLKMRAARKSAIAAINAGRDNDSEEEKRILRRKRIFKYAASVKPGTTFENHSEIYDASGNFDGKEKYEDVHTTVDQKLFEALAKQDHSDPSVKSKIKSMISSLKKKYDGIKSKINDTPPEKELCYKNLCTKLFK